MNGHGFQRRPSSPRSSTSSRPPRGIVAQFISDEIKTAIKSTTAGIPGNSVQILRFLPKGDLQHILNSQTLRSYLRELLSDNVDSGQDSEEGTPNEGSYESTDLDELINNALTLIIGDPARDRPSRRALLALFLYQRRRGLLSTFKTWLLSRRTDFPSDDDLPFSQQTLDEAGILDRYHDYFFDYQSIFTTVILQKGQNQKFTSKDRMPYVGAHLAAQEGSSGIVYTRKIAPYHWEVQLPNGGYTPAETVHPTILAFKVFNGGRSGQEARADFKIERDILEELRNSNFAHKMILLDWGSIAIRDEHGIIEQSLIFECATYSLEEFLMGEKGVETSWTASLLLAKLTDIVQALACLHDNFDVLHLDIKPDNILVFVKATAEGPTLEWKISDFGLARKRTAKPRSGYLLDSNRSTSQSASIIATRDAGRYQAPEIQQRNSSIAGQKSDVWSMGCIALMVMGFVIDGPKRVTQLTDLLGVEYKHSAGVDNFFYVTSDSFEWRSTAEWPHYNYEYLDKYRPAPGIVPGMRHLEAAIHPNVVEWSNKLFRYCHDKPEQPFLTSMLKIIFLSVLLVNMSARIKAIEFYKRLAEVKENWKRMEQTPDGSNEIERLTTQLVDVATTQHQLYSAALPSASPQQRPARQQNINELNENNLPARSAIHNQTPVVSNDNPPAVLDETRSPERSVTTVEYTGLARTESSITSQTEAVPVSGTSEHSQLCLLIVKMASANPEEGLKLKSEIQNELHKETDLVRRPCPRSNCQRHPIHVAIRNKSYEALEMLLNAADSSDLSIPCPGCGGRTAIEEACQSPGDGQALSLFKRFFSELSVPKEFYNTHKNSIGRWAGEALKELTKPPRTSDQRQGPSRENMLRRIFTRNSNTSKPNTSN